MAWRQGQSYSEDLRGRVLASVDGGMATRSAARVFRVSVSYISKALIRRRRTGEVSASLRRGHRPRKLTGEQEVALAGHIAAHPDITLAAMQSWLLSARGVRLSNGAMWSAVERLGLSFKKRDYILYYLNPVLARSSQGGREPHYPGVSTGRVTHFTIYLGKSFFYPCAAGAAQG